MLVWSVAVLFCLFPVFLQTVQRAEFWGAILASAGVLALSFWY